MTMDYTGQTPKYKIDRPLTEQERKDRLSQKLPARVRKSKDIQDWDALIRLNSTFIEVVDKFYTWKGITFAFAFIFFVGAMILTIAISRLTLFEHLRNFLMRVRK